MRKQFLVAGVAAIVALAAVGFVLASNGGEDGPTVENPPLPTAPADGSGGGAAGACPGPDVPGVTQEERERCFDTDSPGGGVVIPGGPIPTEPQVPVTPIDPGTNPQLPADRKAEPAPIDGVDLAIAESFPPQYFLNVQAGLPSGCAQQYRHDVERDGNVITVTVLNSFPSATDIACTAIYGIYELNIALGTDFESGQEYTVHVNNQETLTFTAQ